MALIPHAADDLKAIAQERLTWLDGLMAGKQFTVDVVTPEAIIWSGEADFVSARTTEGEIGILADHHILGEEGRGERGLGSGKA